MSTYEIDDEVVRGLVDNRDLLPPRLLNAIAALEEQIPVPAPTKLGAVVMTTGALNGGRYIRWTNDVHSASPWILAHDHETPYRTDQIGRIVEIVFEGVDS